MGSHFLLWLQAARATSQRGIFLLWQKLIWQKKLLLSNAKMFFPLAMWNSLPFGCTPAMLVSSFLTKIKRKPLLKPGHCLGDPFYCARARSNDPVAVEKDIIRSRSNGKQFPIANGKSLLHLKNFQRLFAISNFYSLEKNCLGCLSALRLTIFV